MAVVTRLQQAGKAILHRGEDSVVTMVPRNHVGFRFNMKHPHDPEYEELIMESIMNEKLKDALDCCQGRQRGHVECLDGEMRFRLIGKIQKAGKEVRLRRTGEHVPLGKVPVLGAHLVLSDTEARIRAAYLNLQRRNVDEMELGCHLSLILKDAKHGEIENLLGQIARQVRRHPMTVRRWITAWNAKDQSIKAEFLKSSGLSMTHLTQISRLKDPRVQGIAASTIKREKYNVRKTSAYVSLLANAEQASAPGAEFTQEQAEKLDEQVRKATNLEPTITLTNMSEWPFMKVATIIIDSISCPYGQQNITYGRCPYETLSENAKKRCADCQEKGYDLKLNKCNAAVRLIAPSDMFYDAVLRSARDIKKKLGLAE